VNLLLDTHVLIWMASNPERLTATVTELLLDNDNTLHLSAVSLWEMQIKARLGKLDMGFSVKECWDEQRELNGIGLLLIEPRHIWRLNDLPDVHRDPFDRLLICQAQCEELTLVTKDRKIALYDLATLW
jgi:PIN domain nuclease of toxin-antitoxin system